MIVLKIIAISIATGVALLQLGLDSKWYDRRTKKHKRIRSLLIVLMILSALTALFLVIYDDWQSQKQIQNLIALKKSAVKAAADAENREKNAIKDRERLRNEFIEKTSKLSKQISEYQEEIRAKDKRIHDLEKQAKIVRSIEGNIECVFSANWAKGRHPGRLTPFSWNKAQVYAYIFETTPYDTSAILFYLENLETLKLSDSDLKVKLAVRLKPGSGPLGQELNYLKNYNHLLVYVPFIHEGDTLDDKIILRDLRVFFIVNGEKKSEIIRTEYFEIPVPAGGNLAGFQLNKNDLFQDIF